MSSATNAFLGVSYLLWRSRCKLSEFRRLYAENLALKACNEALRKELRKAKGKRTAMPIRARALQVLGYLLNRNNVRFQKRYLGTCRSTVRIWTTRFRHPFRKPKNRGGRPPIDPKIVAMILQIKRDNPRFGSVKIAKTLAQMGIQVSRYTVAKVLRENGFDPTGIHQHPWKKWVGACKDEIWAMDFCFTQLRNGMEMMLLVVCDTFTKEIMQLKVFEGRDCIASSDVAATLGSLFYQTERQPEKIVHDRDPLFQGQVMRALAVLEIDQLKSPPRYPTMNCFAERTVQSVKHELLDHIRAETPEALQTLLDDYRLWFNEYRAHEGLNGMTPDAYANGKRIEHVPPINDLTAGRLKRVEFANGLLTGYRWLDEPPVDQAA